MKSIKDKASKIRVAACIAGVTAVALACLVLANCSAQTMTSEGVSPGQGGSATASEASDTASSSASAPQSGEDDEDSSDSTSGGASEPQQVTVAVPSGETTPQNAASGVSGGASQSGSQSGETPVTSDPAPSGGESSERRTWVTDYEDVWVEDSPAWDESVPVYGSVEVSICNICGADITGNTAAHGKQHMLAGEGSGHHSEVHEVVVGHDTVHHDATGHWERVESGGHWE